MRLTRSAPFAFRVVDRNEGRAAIIYRRRPDDAGRDRLQRIAALSPLAFTAGTSLLRDAAAKSVIVGRSVKVNGSLKPGEFYPMDSDWGSRAACFAMICAGLREGERMLKAASRFARTVPCPDTGHPTPLVPDWSLSRPAGGAHIVAEAVITDGDKGKWTISVRKVGKEAGDIPRPPMPTYGRGKGISLFTSTVIPADYIKAMAQSGRMGSALYAVAVKAVKLDFRPPEEAYLRALEAAERELARLRPQWERDGIIPTEEYPEVTTDPRPRV